MLDRLAAAHRGEYLEWGNPNQERYYKYMRSYFPLRQPEEGRVSAILVETPLNDSQVMYWEPAKYVAKLRTLRPTRTRLLLKTIMEAGHGGASGRYDALKELAFTYAFILDQVGLAK
jgi:oligopeptidase B